MLKSKLLKNDSRECFNEIIIKLSHDIVNALMDKHFPEVEREAARLHSNDLKLMATACLHTGFAGLKADDCPAHLVLPITFALISAQYPEISAQEISGGISEFGFVPPKTVH